MYWHEKGTRSKIIWFQTKGVDSEVIAPNYNQIQNNKTSDINSVEMDGRPCQEASSLSRAVSVKHPFVLYGPMCIVECLNLTS